MIFFQKKKSKSDSTYTQTYRIKSGNISIPMIMRKYKIGSNKATIIMNKLFELGYVSDFIENDLRKMLVDEITIWNYINYNFDLIYIPDNTSSNNEYTTKVYYDSLEGHEFEYFCADLLRKNGFINVEVTQGSGDDGIDILAEKDDIKYAIQCKCYSDNIGNKAVQEAYAGVQMYKCDIGVVLTNRYFTESAKRTALETRIKLWDRDKLEELIKKAEL